MHGRIDVQAVDQMQQFLLGRLGRQPVQHAGHTDPVAGPLFVAHVDLAGRIFSHQHRGQARDDAAMLRESRHLVRHLGLNCLRKSFAIQ